MDPILLARIQFAATAAYHFCFVPINVGLGLIVALNVTRANKTHAPEDIAHAKWWVKLFAITFAVGIATGITMEFSFGTNWANYSRFVGDIFGAPLAAEALLAFFMESTFLGVLLWGRNRVSDKFYTASGWLVFAGSALSCLWILIANSWMQTPAGYEVVGGKAVLTDFFAAAFNPSTLARYTHTVTALIIMGAFITIAIAAYHLRHKDKSFGAKQMRYGVIISIVAFLVMIPAMHAQASVVAEYQPEKLAAMEGQYEDGPVGMYLIGWVDEANQTTTGLEVPIPGMTSILASGNPETPYPGLNTSRNTFEERIAEIHSNPDYLKDGEQFYQQVGSDELQAADLTAPVNATFQAYHLMVAIYGFIALWLIFALIVSSKVKKGGQPSQGLLKALMWAPIFPFIAIEAGWFTAELGRQPWIVYNELLVVDAVSPAVDGVQLIITLLLFLVVYAFLMFMFFKNALRHIKEGPALEGEVK